MEVAGPLGTPLGLAQRNADLQRLALEDDAVEGHGLGGLIH